MKNSEDIIEKDLGDGVVSFNFKRDVFFKDRWNEINSVARGMFINTEDSSIMARSYVKFFNFREGNKNSVEFLKENLKFPVTAYEKYNGFLGLLSYNKKTDDFFFASKSTNSSDFAKWFRNIFKLSVGKNESEWIKNYLKNNNSTMIFEVIDPINDPHIIKYDCQKIILLDVMKNNFNTEKVDYETLKFIGMRAGLKVKKLVEIFDEFEVMLDFINYNGNEVEGYVIEDLNGYMFKAKTDYYLFWKSCRRIKDNLIKGKKIDKSRFSKSQIEVLDFMKSCPDLNEKSIIQVREEFFSEKEKKKMPF
jgi:tRNA splicing ligase